MTDKDAGVREFDPHEVIHKEEPFKSIHAECKSAYDQLKAERLEWEARAAIQHSEIGKLEDELEHAIEKLNRVGRHRDMLIAALEEIVAYDDFHKSSAIARKALAGEK